MEYKRKTHIEPDPPMHKYSKEKMMKDNYYEILAAVGVIASIFLCLVGEIPCATFTMVTAFMCLYMQDREER